MFLNTVLVLLQEGTDPEDAEDFYTEALARHPLHVFLGAPSDISGLKEEFDRQKGDGRQIVTLMVYDVVHASIPSALALYEQHFNCELVFPTPLTPQAEANISSVISKVYPLTVHRRLDGEGMADFVRRVI